MNFEQELTAGPATPLVLTILSEGESYGYVIIKRVRELYDGEIGWTDAMLYPLFHRLRRLGYLTTQWRTMPEGRRRRYYAITSDGRTALADLRSRWTTASATMSGRGRGPGATACVRRPRLALWINATPA